MRPRVERHVAYLDGLIGRLERHMQTRLIAEVERILEQHPRLKLILAHFCFLSGDLARAAAFLDRWPNVCYDITPGDEMYVRFSAAPAAWRAS